jgi:hypothetical protein
MRSSASIKTTLNPAARSFSLAAIPEAPAPITATVEWGWILSIM